MLNISPIGRSCTPEERIEFSELDKVQGPDLGPASPGCFGCSWSYMLAPFPRRREAQLQAVRMQQGRDRLGDRSPRHRWMEDTWFPLEREDGRHLVSLGTTNARGWPAGFPVLWESPREGRSYLTVCFLIYSTQRWPSSCVLSPTSAAPKELELMDFPNWEGHGRSAGQVSRGFDPCSYQFLPGEAFLGLRDQLVFARLFKQNWRVCITNRAVGN